MTFHIYTANTPVGVFKIAIEASEFSRSDAISVARAEFCGPCARVLPDVQKARKLPSNASESSKAKGWAWTWRAQ